MLNNLDYHLPKNTIFIIKNYMWGSKQDWMDKFNKIILEYSTKEDIKDNVIPQLKICRRQKRLNTYTNIEDCFYCSICGEKTLDFPFLFNQKSYEKCMCIV